MFRLGSDGLEFRPVDDIVPVKNKSYLEFSATTATSVSTTTTTIEIKKLQLFQLCNFYQQIPYLIEMGILPFRPYNA